MKTTLIDIHTHNPRAEAILSLTPREYQNLSPDYSGLLSVGIHPWDTIISTEELERLLGIVERAANNDARVMAIGEIGFDALRGSSLDIQREIFSRQVEIAVHTTLPVIIHCVKAWEELISAVKALKPDVPMIIHGFRGNEYVARMLLRAGFYLSIGAKFNPKAVAEVPDSRLLVESDEAVINLAEHIERLAHLRGQTQAALLDILAANTARILKERI